MYVVVFYLAMEFRPVEVIYATKPAEVRLFLKNCDGHANVVQTARGYELTCREK